MSDSVLNAPYIRLIADGRKSICDAFFADPEITPTELRDAMSAKGHKYSMGVCHRALKNLRDFTGVSTVGVGRAAKRVVPGGFDVKQREYRDYVSSLARITHSLAPAPEPAPAPVVTAQALSPKMSAVLEATQLCEQLAQLIKQGHIKSVTVYRDECSDGEPISQNIAF